MARFNHPIGVGKVTLPALRTVRAVLPHTALQLLVSSSGVSRGFPGCLQGEQPEVREEGVRPLHMIGPVSSHRRALVLLAQDGAQPSSDELVKSSEQARPGMLEIPKPAAQHWIEISNDPLKA